MPERPGLKRGNLLAGIPACLPEELCETLHETPALRLERIVSRGHASPASGWYDQERDEWVALLEGEAEIEFADGNGIIGLRPGDWLLIPARVRHRVTRTAPDRPSVWLAAHIGIAKGD